MRMCTKSLNVMEPLLRKCQQFHPVRVYTKKIESLFRFQRRRATSTYLNVVLKQDSEMVWKLGPTCCRKEHCSLFACSAG
mmetsp:Transcript_36468/g.48873  ORF Transcript_36468/g.48873 Transcript_36468/m.48873 type:complete len:80 (-) Transcript_36468:33-272(-)